MPEKPLNTLVTGFGPFPGVMQNTSGRIIEKLKNNFHGDDGIGYMEIPTEYDAGEKAIERILSNYNPELVLMLGVEPRAKYLSLEMMALNFTHASTPDNTGRIITNNIIKKEAPAALWTTIPVNPLLNHLRSNGYLSDIKATGGNYVCNHLYFLMLHELNKLEDKECGFIHVPPDSEVNPEYGWPLRLLCDSVKDAVEFLSVNNRKLQ